MAIRIPVQDSAPTVAFEDAVQLVFDLLGEVPEFRSTRGRQIELHGTLALAVLAMTSGHTTYRENRHHYVRDNRWREDRATWRTGDSAFVMFVLLAISPNLLRTAARDWTDQTPMTLRSMAAEYTTTSAPDTLLEKPP